MDANGFLENYSQKLFTTNGTDRWEAIAHINRPVIIFKNIASGQQSARIVGSEHFREMRPANPSRLGPWPAQ